MIFCCEKGVNPHDEGWLRQSDVYHALQEEQVKGNNSESFHNKLIYMFMTQK